ncbi:hypothetical protein ABG768_003139, partial [Culter alburnus]
LSTDLLLGAGGDAGTGVRTRSSDPDTRDPCSVSARGDGSARGGFFSTDSDPFTPD